MEEIRKTVRFSKEEYDFIMNEEELKSYQSWSISQRSTTFSERFRNMIKLYKFQKKRIEDLSDECARLSDKSDIKMSDEGYRNNENTR